MRKNLPNVLLLLVVLANVFFMGLYIRNNGIGLFLSTTGTVFLVLGIIIFIFFLSIDPGYGWTKSIDLTKNYIMIFTAMAVCMAGVVLIVSGKQLHDLHVASLSQKERCLELAAGKAPEVLKRDWYTLQDREDREFLHVYLFQKKSDRNEYKIIVTADRDSAATKIRQLVIASDSIPAPLQAAAKDASCPEVFEKNIRVDFDWQQQQNEQVRLDLLISLFEDAAAGALRTEPDKTLQFSLESKTP